MKEKNRGKGLDRQGSKTEEQTSVRTTPAEIKDRQEPRIAGANPTHSSPQQQAAKMDSGRRDSVSSSNYQLTRVDTNHSLNSLLAYQPIYRVSLNLSKREIALIRYAWNTTLLEEPLASIVPGLYPPDKTNTRKGTSSVAGSRFCLQFYLNLLSLEPHLEDLFPSIKHQAVAFAGVLSLAIAQLENLSALDDYMMNLAKRHSRILNIESSHFELMGEALIQTFHERFPGKFTSELEELWVKVYLYLSNTLLQYGIDPHLDFSLLKSYSYSSTPTRSSLSSRSTLGSDNYTYKQLLRLSTRLTNDLNSMLSYQNSNSTEYMELPPQPEPKTSRFSASFPKKNNFFSKFRMG